MRGGSSSRGCLGSHLHRSSSSSLGCPIFNISNLNTVLCNALILISLYLWRLVGELYGHLQESDGESRIDLGGDPDPEVGVDLLGVDYGLHDLVAKVEREVAILEEEPVTLGNGELHELSCRVFLSLSHG